MALAPTIGVAELLILLLFGGAGALPGVPPRAPDPVLYQVAPEDCLFYCTWSGSTVPDPESKNETERLLAEPQVQDFFAHAEARSAEIMSQLARRQSGTNAELARLAPQLLKVLLTRPGVFFISDLQLSRGRPTASAALAVSLDEQLESSLRELQPLVQRLLGARLAETAIAGTRFAELRLDPPVPTIRWGKAGRYFVVALGEGVIEQSMERAATPPPAWLRELQAELPVPRVASLSYLNIGRLVALARQEAGSPQILELLEQSGLENVTNIGSVAGLDETGFVSHCRIGLSGEPQGLVKLLSGPGLAAEQMASIPADTPLAAALRLDLNQVVETVLSLAKIADPQQAERIGSAWRDPPPPFGTSLRRLLDSLGDVWQLYAAPGAGGLLTGWTATVSIQDHTQCAAALQELVALADQLSGEERRQPRVRRSHWAGHDYFTLAVPDDDFPLAPSWCLTETHLIVGAFPQAIKARLELPSNAKSLAEVPAVAAAFSGAAAPQVLCYEDVRTLFRVAYPVAQIGLQALANRVLRNGFDLDLSHLPTLEVIERHLGPAVCWMLRQDNSIHITLQQTVPAANLGGVVPLAIGAALPAVQQARSAARRAQSMNNLKQLGLALHICHDTHQAFPALYNCDPEGKPLLSWRVHILPYLEETELYRQFHLDEPWDSPHNKSLVDRMPRVFQSPQGQPGRGKTNYLAIVHEASAWSAPTGDTRGATPPKGMRLADFTDGTSNTILVIEADNDQAVPWTMPSDVTPRKDQVKEMLKGPLPQGTLALFGDGHVAFLSRNIDEQTLWSMLTRSGGEPIEHP